MGFPGVATKFQLLSNKYLKPALVFMFAIILMQHICISTIICWTVLLRAISLSCLFLHLALQLFVDTQMFAVLSDSRLSTFENGYS